MKIKALSIIRPALMGLALMSLPGSVAGAGPSPVSAKAASVTPECFVPVKPNPLIKSGSFFPGSTWNDPSVLRIDGLFVMYASSDTNHDHDIKIYRLVSKDGLKWELSPSHAVFSRSEAGWDSRSVETPSVVRFKGKYHLFYTGYSTRYDDAFDFKIGHAVSEDGIRWVRKGMIAKPTDPRNSKPTFQFNQYVVAEPGAVVVRDRLQVYFSAVGVRGGKGSQTIGLITSDDGEHWTPATEVLALDETIYPRASAFVGYSTPSAIVLGEEIHLFFDVAQEKPKWAQVRLHHAKAGIGKAPWVQDSASISEKGAEAWAKEEVRAPSPVEVDGKLYLYYAGHSGLVAGIGLSICDLRRGR